MNKSQSSNSFYIIIGVIVVVLLVLFTAAFLGGTNGDGGHSTAVVNTTPPPSVSDTDTLTTSSTSTATTVAITVSPSVTPTPAVSPTPTLTETSTSGPSDINPPTATVTPIPILTSTLPPTDTTTPPPAVTFTPTPAPETKITIPLNLVAGRRPNVDAEEAAWLPVGVEVGVNGRNIAGTWLNITAPNGQLGWVSVSATKADEQGIDIGKLQIMLSPATPTPTSGITAIGTITPTPLPQGEIILISPTSPDDRFFSDIDFIWEWHGEELPPDFGFELLIWESRLSPTSAHNAAEDNRNGKIQALGSGRYRFNLDVTYAPGVRGRKDVYHWTVRLVRLEPAYDDLGNNSIRADHQEFSFDP